MTLSILYRWLHLLVWQLYFPFAVTARVVVSVWYLPRMIHGLIFSISVQPMLIFGVDYPMSFLDCSFPFAATNFLYMSLWVRIISSLMELNPAPMPTPNICSTTVLHPQPVSWNSDESAVRQGWEQVADFNHQIWYVKINFAKLLLEKRLKLLNKNISSDYQGISPSTFPWS